MREASIADADAAPAPADGASAMDGAGAGTDAERPVPPDGGTSEDGAAAPADAASDDGAAGSLDAGGSCTSVGARAYCTARVTWAQAHDECASRGLVLARIDNVSENNAVINESTIWGTLPFWVGLNDRAVEGTFVWEDATSPRYTNWDAAEPNGGASDDVDCVLVPVPISARTWADVSCAELHAFVCEAP